MYNIHTHTHRSSLTSNILLSLGQDGTEILLHLPHTHAHTHTCFTILVKTFYIHGDIYTPASYKNMPTHTHMLTLTLTQWPLSADLTSHLQKPKAERDTHTHLLLSSSFLVIWSAIVRYVDEVWGESVHVCVCVFMRIAGISKRKKKKGRWMSKVRGHQTNVVYAGSEV